MVETNKMDGTKMCIRDSSDCDCNADLNYYGDFYRKISLAGRSDCSGSLLSLIHI